MLIQNQDHTLPCILIVEDDDTLREMLYEFFTETGFHVFVTSQGRQAIALFENYRCNVVITDFTMPDITGMEVLQCIKNMEPYTSVIMISGFLTEHFVAQALSNGAYDLILKPFKLNRIKFIVERAYEESKLLKEARKREMQKRLATLDITTGVYNFEFFNDMLVREIVRAKRYPKPLSVLLMEYDNFKHCKGTGSREKILEETTKMLRHNIRNTDLLARCGSDEFGILLVETEKVHLPLVIHRLTMRLKALQVLFKEMLKEDVQLNASFGFASFPADGSSKPELIRKANLSLFQSKQEKGML